MLTCEYLKGAESQMVIQSYEYVPEEDIYKINIKEYYAEISGLEFQFLDLHFKKLMMNGK